MMNKDQVLDFEELSDEAGQLASFALALEEAMAHSGSSAEGYSGATHLLSNLLHDHARKMKAFGKGSDAI